jgi:hypothetical protein
MSLMSVNGTALKEPSTYNIVKRDLDSENSYTSETGILVRDMIRANHVTIEVAWEKLSLSELQALSSLISNGQPSFTLTYFDYFTGADVTGKFYAHDRSGTAVKVNRRNDNGYECYQLSTQFIEF